MFGILFAPRLDMQGVVGNADVDVALGVDSRQIHPDDERVPLLVLLDAERRVGFALKEASERLRDVESTESAATAASE